MILFFLGFLIVFGSVGGIETAPPEQSLFPLIMFAIVGLGLMGVGTSTLKERY